MTVHRPPAVRPHRRHTNEFWVVCVHNKFCFGAKTNGHPRFVKQKQISPAKSTQNKKKFFVSVDGNCFYIRIFYIFYQLCPLVWNIEIERGKENEKVGGKQAKLNESESGREPEKGGKIVYCG